MLWTSSHSIDFRLEEEDQWITFIHANRSVRKVLGLGEPVYGTEKRSGCITNSHQRLPFWFVPRNRCRSAPSYTNPSPNTHHTRLTTRLSRNYIYKVLSCLLYGGGDERAIIEHLDSPNKYIQRSNWDAVKLIRAESRLPSSSLILTTTLGFWVSVFIRVPSIWHM